MTFLRNAQEQPLYFQSLAQEEGRGGGQLHRYEFSHAKSQPVARTRKHRESAPIDPLVHFDRSISTQDLR
jgi:hypothetical protein